VLRLPWAATEANLSLVARPPEGNASLMELLVSEKCI